MRAVMTAPSLFPNRGGRGSRIRTCDLKYPKLPRYQTALYPETLLNPLVSLGFSGSAVARPKRSEGSQKEPFRRFGTKSPEPSPERRGTGYHGGAAATRKSVSTKVG